MKSMWVVRWILVALTTTLATILIVRGNVLVGVVLAGDRDHPRGAVHPAVSPARVVPRPHRGSARVPHRRSVTSGRGGDRLGGAARATLDHRCEVVEGERGRVQEALGVAAAEPAQRPFVIAGLDPFGDDAHLEPAGEGDDCVDDRLVGAVERDVAHEPLIDLEHVDREVAYEAQRRRAGAEVVERDREAGRARGGEALGRGVDVVEDLLFGDLDPEVVDRAVVRRKELLEPFERSIRSREPTTLTQIRKSSATSPRSRNMMRAFIASTKIPWSIRRPACARPRCRGTRPR